VDRAPTLSVVIATYNRSQVLKHAIQSVVNSTFEDWELIIVGDGCTDDTEACVAEWRDERIRFVNLPVNSGDQSAPHNFGVGMARGRCIAFLNQDDLYFPDHLATCVAALDSGDIDLVWAACVIANSTDASDGPSSSRFSVSGVPSARRYTPFAFYCASSWVFRRALVARVGPWPHPDSVYVTPSQAWLFRAWRSGATLRFVPKFGVLLVFSGSRASSYATRESPEHTVLARGMAQDAGFPEHVFEEAALSAAALEVTTRYHSPLKSLVRALLGPAFAMLTAAGIHPHSLLNAVRYGRRGGFIRWHRRFTGIR
jgi:cellulose synthase/poly-beta-1,6-N-acetylglucosamine synthase-like glycosyltransferase